MMPGFNSYLDVSLLLVNKCVLYHVPSLKFLIDDAILFFHQCYGSLVNLIEKEMKSKAQA